MGRTRRELPHENMVHARLLGEGRARNPEGGADPGLDLGRVRRPPQATR